MAEISSVVRGRGDSSLAALVGVRLLVPDTPAVLEALGAPLELLADRYLRIVVIMLGMSTEVTVLDVFSSSVGRGRFSIPCRSPSSFLRLFPRVAGSDVDLFSVFLPVSFSFWVGFFLTALFFGMASASNLGSFE